MAYPDDWPLAVTATAKCDAAGAGSALLSVPAGETWQISRMATFGNTTKPGEVRVWRGTGMLLGSSRYAVADTSTEAGLTLMPGETLRVDWSACDAGAQMTFTAEGITGRV